MTTNVYTVQTIWMANFGAQELDMVTRLKMFAPLVVNAVLVMWYLSDHPHPLSNSDSALLVVSALVSVWIAFLVWRVTFARIDEKQLALVRKFVMHFLDSRNLQSIVDAELRARAVAVDQAVQKSILFQKGGMVAFGMGDTRDESEESLTHSFENLQHFVSEEVKTAKSDFWALYDLTESCGSEFSITVRIPRSYKQYLPTSSQQTNIPADKA